MAQTDADAWTAYVETSERFMTECSRLRRDHHSGKPGLSGPAEEQMKLYDAIRLYAPDQELIQQRMAVVRVSASTATTVLVSHTATQGAKMRVVFDLCRRYPEIPTLKYYLASVIDTARARGHGGEGWHALSPNLHIASCDGEYTMTLQHFRESRGVALRLLRSVLECYEPKSMVHDESSALLCQIQAELGRVSLGRGPDSVLTFCNRFNPQASQKLCILCGKVSARKCGTCGTKYCSVECQKLDRRMHRADCRAAAPPGGALIALTRPPGCAKCGRAGRTLSCARCLSADYCGADCQRADWKAHKPNCAATA